MRLNLERVRLNSHEATTEDLLDRVTVYRSAMEEAALEIIEEELRARGVGPEEVREHGALRERETLPLADGTVAVCSFCHRPAVAEGWGWHRWWGLVPLFPRYFRYCTRHL
jgi:hypothetical protein